MDDWQKFIAVAESKLDQEWAAATDWVKRTGFADLMQFLQMLNQTDGPGVRNFTDDQLGAMRNFAHIAFVEAMKRVAERQHEEREESEEPED